MQPDHCFAEDSEDPIVAEVRRNRRKILARFNGDVDAYSSYIEAVEAEKRSRGVQYIQHPPPRIFEAAEPDTGGAI